MNFQIKNHLKNQKSNYMIVILAILLSTYFSTINTCMKHTQLVEKKFVTLKKELLNQRLFMKKILASSQFSNQNQSSLLEVFTPLQSTSVTNQDVIKLTSQWITLFNTYLTNNPTKQISQSEKSAFSRLISYGVQYNLDLSQQQTFSQKWLSQRLCSQPNLTPTYSMLSNNLFDTSNFVIVL